MEDMPDEEFNNIVDQFGERLFGTDNPKVVKQMMKGCAAQFLPPIRLKVKKVGTSMGFILPVSIAKMFNLEVGQEVEIVIISRS
jgi:hypothetical protein|tara:strand:- start:9674 stop:9925 length:252 start_codon:yes stop_codon:yes gene_type:complete